MRGNGPETRGFLVRDHAQGFERRLAAKWNPSRQEFIEDGSEAVDIRGGDHILAAGCLFGRHVGRRAEHRSRLRERIGAFEAPSQAEVRDVRFALRVDEDVRGLEVTVQDPALVCVVNGPCHRVDESGNGFLVALDSRFGLGEIAALDELHREIVAALVFPDFIDGNDVGMVEVGCRLGLGVETLDVGG